MWRLEKFLNVEHDYREVCQDMVPLTEELRQWLSGVIKFTSVIGPYYDGKKWSNPNDYEGIGTALESGLHVGVSGLPVSYGLFRDSGESFIASWLLICGINYIALRVGHYVSEKEISEGRRTYGHDGRAILSD